MAMATGVILNPWWEVPPSITKEVAGKPGYVALKDPKTASSSAGASRRARATRSGRSSS